MTLQIDDAFIREWHPRYVLTEDDDEEYARLVDAVAHEMKSTGTISKKTFLDIWGWKGAMRVIGLTTIYVEGQKTVPAAEDEYEARYAPAFCRAAVAPPEQKLAELLADGVKLPGVGAPTGSTLLHFIHPEIMPIIDVRTVETLFAAGLISSEVRELETYEEYRRAIDGIGRRCPGWTLREIDRALFAYHKQVLGKGRQGTEKRRAKWSRNLFVNGAQVNPDPIPGDGLTCALGQQLYAAGVAGKVTYQCTTPGYPSWPVPVPRPQRIAAMKASGGELRSKWDLK